MIGSPISPVVSDIYVENFEKKAMVSFTGIPPGFGGARWMIPLLSSRN